MRFESWDFLILERGNNLDVQNECNSHIILASRFYMALNPAIFEIVLIFVQTRVKLWARDENSSTRMYIGTQLPIYPLYMNTHTFSWVRRVAAWRVRMLLSLNDIAIPPAHRLSYTSSAYGQTGNRNLHLLHRKQEWYHYTTESGVSKPSPKSWPTSWTF